MTPDWIRTKADAVALAWRSLRGADPSPATVSLALAHAWHETICGDAKGWEGEFNWGAVQHRVPTAEERAVLAGLSPHPSHVTAARQLLADAVAAGRIPAPDHCALHVDWSPNRQAYYWVHFWAFGSDAEGATFFLRLLTERHPRTAEALARGADPGEYAALLYLWGYYEGSHAGARPVAQRTPPLNGAEQANVNDYARALGGFMPQIRAALATWSPPPPALTDADRAAADAAVLASLSATLDAVPVGPGGVDGAA